MHILKYIKVYILSTFYRELYDLFGPSVSEDTQAHGFGNRLADYKKNGTPTRAPFFLFLKIKKSTTVKL